MLKDIRYAARRLRRAPAFTSISVVSLALGIGATTLIFSIINALLLRPPAGVTDPDRLVAIYTSDFSGPRFGSSSYPDFIDFRDNAAALDGVMGFSVATVTLGREGPGVTLFAELVAGDYFGVLGVRPVLGRFFDATETSSMVGARVVVLGEGLWGREYGRDADIIGRTVILDGEPFVVIGIAPGELVSALGVIVPDIWLPAGVMGEAGDARGSRGLFLRGRLGVGATLETAQAQLEVVARRLHGAFPDSWTDVRGDARVVTVLGADEARIPPQARGAVVGVLALLMIIVLLLLLLACSNVANLLLTRAARRRREIAVRLAVGASRWQLVRQLLIESVALSFVGGVLGAAATAGVARYFSSGHIPAPVELRLDFGVDVRVLTFAAIASIGTGVLFGLLPALQASNPDLVKTLKTETGEGGVRLKRLGVRNALVILQVTGSLVLLVGTGLFLRSLQAASNVELGFDPNGVAVFPVDLPEARYDTERGRGFFEEVQMRVAALPGVDGVSLAASIPLAGGASRRSVRIEGYEPSPGEDLEYHVNVVAPGYFELLRIAVRGRSFTASDRETSPAVVVVNQTFADRFWPEGEAIGRRVGIGSVAAEVVGVASDGRYTSLTDEALPHFWLPFSQAHRGRMYVHARTSGDPDDLFATLTREVSALDRELPLVTPTTMRSMTDTATLPQRLVSVVLAFASAIALFLAAIGIYGVMAYAVSQRVREVGIRIALGAVPRSVVRLVVRDGLVLAALGMTIGILIVVGVTRLVTTLLFGVDPLDPLSVGAGVLILGSVATVAAIVPAMRASKVNPVEALRSE